MNFLKEAFIIGINLFILFIALIIALFIVCLALLIIGGIVYFLFLLVCFIVEKIGNIIESKKTSS